MAAKTTTYDEAADYVVKLARPVRTGAMRLLPGCEHIIRGRLLNRLVAENGEDLIDNVRPAA